MDHLERLRDRIDLSRIPFTDRGSRILVQRCPDRDALFIRLAERWTALEGPEGKFATRPPFVDDCCLLDGNRAALPFRPVTFPGRIVMDTKIGTFALAFVDEETLLLSLPSTRCGIAFRARVDEWQPDRRGAVLRMTGRIRRHLALTTNAPLLENEIASANGGCSARLLCDALEGGQSFLLNITPRHALNRSVPSSAAALDAAAGRWRAWFAAAPAVEDEFARQYCYAWWLMGAGLAAPRDYTSREVLMPSKLKYIGAWAWDAYFHALAYRHVDWRLAHDQLRVMADHQQPDGMLPDAVHDDGSSAWLDHPIPGPVTKPPLLGWAAWKLFETDRDREFLDEIYDAAARNQDWWLQQNDQDRNGLCEYLHPYSSGLDDSPLWDEGTPVESPDLNTYLVLQAQALERWPACWGWRRRPSGGAARPRGWWSE